MEDSILFMETTMPFLTPMETQFKLESLSPFTLFINHQINLIQSMVTPISSKNQMETFCKEAITNFWDLMET